MALPGMKRILLKLSGEALMGSTPFGIDPETVATMAAEVKEAKDSGLEICLVLDGVRGLVRLQRIEPIPLL